PSGRGRVIRSSGPGLAHLLGRGERHLATVGRGGEVVSTDHQQLRKVVRAAQHVKEAESRLVAARQSFYASLRDAQATGISISAMAQALGVSRQAVQKLVSRNPRS